MNNFLNENAHEIIRELKPHFAQEIDRLVVRVFSEAIAALPVDTWEGLKKLQHDDGAASDHAKGVHVDEDATKKPLSDDKPEKTNFLDKKPSGD